VVICPADGCCYAKADGPCAASIYLSFARNLAADSSDREREREREREKEGELPPRGLRAALASGVDNEATVFSRSQQR